jgi:hypothetical protein
VRSSRLPVAALAAAAALVTGCAGGAGEQADPQPAATPSAVATGAVSDVLAFTAPLVGGGELDASTVAGETAVFWFWSPF